MSMLLMVKAMNMKVGNPLRKLVLLKLADNSNDDGECWPSYQHIADQCEISRSSVKAHVRELEKCGLLKREMRSGEKGNSSNVFHLTLDNPGQQITGVGQELPEGGAGAARGGGAGAAPRTSHSLEPVNEPVIEPNHSSDKPASTDVMKVYTYWQKVMGKQRSKLDNNRRGLIERALKNYSVDDLKQAIDGCAASPFHMGQNRDKKKYNGLELILRNSEKIEGFRDNCGKHIADAHGGFKPGDYDDVGFMSDGAREALGL